MVALLLSMVSLIIVSCGGRSGAKAVAADGAYANYSQTTAEGMRAEKDRDFPGEYEEVAEEAPAPSLAVSEQPARPMPKMARGDLSDDAPEQGGADVGGLSPDNQAEPSSPPGQPLATPEPLVVYNGFLRLRVRRLLDALDAISEITKNNHGYVESMSENVIVVRIPGDNFQEMMAEFAKLGNVLFREISAVEVTQQYTDLKARLEVATKARERLYKLLDEAATDERLAILEEIKRLSEQIESIKSTLSTLQNLLDFFTITIELEAIVNTEETTVHQSPFPWIRALVAHRTTLFDGANQFELALPSDFVLFTEDDDYRAQSADTTILRGGVVKNDPEGTNLFWINALKFEMEGRGEILVQADKAGSMDYLLYRNDDVAPRWYLVAVSVQGEDVYVLEVFYPNEDAFKEHHDDMVKSLGTFKVK